MAFLAAAAPILSAVGAGVGAIGAITGGEAQAAEAKYQSEVARNNQTIANQNAAYASAAGEQQTANVGLQQRAKAGAITTQLAANNLDVNTGSPSEVRRSQAELGQLSTETTRANAALQNYGYRTQATSFQAESQLEAAEAPMDVTAGFLKGGGLVLSNASNLPTKWFGLGDAAAGAVGPGTGGLY